MIVLGVHLGYRREDENDPVGYAGHDAAAAIVQDNQILAAIEDERLNRVKHSNSFPLSAIRHVFDVSGLDISDIDRVAVDMDVTTAESIDRHRLLNDREFRPPPGRSQVVTLLNSALNHDIRPKLRFCDHHVAHAWSAFAPSLFDESLVLSIDGDGDRRSGMVLIGRGKVLRRLRTFSVQQSLGNLYERLIKVIGYSRFDEYKVMALAPYGDPRVYEKVFSRGYQLLPDGDYAIADGRRWLMEPEVAGLLRDRRRPGDPITQAHKDFAAAIQQTLERIVMHVLRHFRDTTGLKNLSLAGGVAHNCSMNGAILYSRMFDDVFVQPVAHDAGGALGAAWAAVYESVATPARPSMTHLSFGTPIGSGDEIRRALESWMDCISFRESTHIARDTAKLLADGAVIGWVQGRSEFGPRALGNRSILADPRPAENRALINEMVKKREPYRPFAPSVLESRVREYFEVPPEQTRFPFMVFVLRVRAHVRALLGAVTHVDGTARVQTVSDESNQPFAALIREFDRLTGVPILLNTSFNNHAEPIVDSVNDAVACFLTTGLHHVVVGPFVISKTPTLDRPVLFRLIPSVPLSRKLVRRTRRTAHDIEVVFELENTKSAYFGPTTVPVSRRMFELLERCDGKKTVAQILGETAALDETDTASIAGELFELWTNRIVALWPARTKPAGVRRPRDDHERATATL